MFVCVHEYMHPGVFRPDGSPPGTIHSLIHTVDKSVYKGSIHRRINVSETAPRRPPQSLGIVSTEHVQAMLLYGVHGPVPGPTRRDVRTGCQTCARSVRHPVSRLMPHGVTTVPSTGRRGTTSRRRYRLNDPWYHRGWYRLFSLLLRHFAHLTLPRGRWRWSGKKRA